MPFLNRLFQSKRARNYNSKPTIPEPKKPWISPEFDKKQVRLVVYLDSDLRGRQLLFDSKAFPQMEDNNEEFLHVRRNNAVMLPGKCSHGLYPRPGSDVEILEEMIFGSVAMAYKGASLKVHILRSPHQLMLTKVFLPEQEKKETGSEVDSDSYISLPPADLSSLKCSSSKGNIAHSLPMDMPLRNYDAEEDSGRASITSSDSFTTSFPSPGSSTASSYNSLHRRWMRAQKTSLESRGRKGSQEIVGSDTSSLPRSRRNKLGIAVLFNLWNDEEKNSMFLTFFFAHIPLFEGHLEKLSQTVNHAFNNKKYFLSIVMEGLEILRSDLHDLYTAPRLSEPVWLSMMAHSNYKYVHCNKFMQQFTALVDKFENKNTHFFISTVISAVLTYHLAWVPTVTPTGGTTSKKYMDKHSAKWLDALARTHPYNPLWAQLGDLYGSIGNPLRLSRTVVTGKKADLVSKILHVLSYFIRCSEVHENIDLCNVTSALEGVSFDDTSSECERTLSDIISMDRESIMDVQINNLINEFRTNEIEKDDTLPPHEKACSMTSATVQEHLPCENTHIVGHATSLDSHQTDAIVTGRRSSSSSNSDATSLCQNQKKNRSKLSEQLAQHDFQQSSSKSTSSICDVQNGFKEDVNSTFDEYFTSSEPRTKDEIVAISEVGLPIVDILSTSNSIATSVITSSTFPDDEDSLQDGQPSLSATSSKTSLSNGQPVSAPTKVSLARSVSSLSEASRSRHMSSASANTHDVELIDPLFTCKELPMPKCNSQGTKKAVSSFAKNFGRSLLADFSDHYLSDFVLHGTSSSHFHRKMNKDLQQAVQHSILDEPITEAVCILANTDEWNVSIASSCRIDKSPIPCSASRLVCDMVESVSDLWKLKMSPEFCMMHLEDRLQEIYFKSMMLVEYAHGINKPSMKELTTMLGFDASDIPLLLAVASTHSSQAA
ncbi:folliculin-interacting protein 1 isoform X1 [Octopus bimaculoides]|uniref:UDENN FNIP1/2-type domain-containing protein n=1 Tax=Octopus bimaculoides TaxID=37653 RepID=A0A0L8GY41_OCTBM|nr:folliculin-interacting protein 1 isoform X1 [Octopus bimaculoides]|eukprot:XP_014777165.1 PREDICTED: folliculin-interacting protein 1-like isoform X1 [Octopus bimaculoides]